MPPKNQNRRVAPRHGPLAPEEGSATGYMKATYEALTARENLGVIRAVGIFGVSYVRFEKGIVVGHAENGNLEWELDGKMDNGKGAATAAMPI